MNRKTFLKTSSLAAGGTFLSGFEKTLAATDSGKRPARIVFVVQANGMYAQAIAPEGCSAPTKGASGKSSDGERDTTAAEVL